MIPWGFSIGLLPVATWYSSQKTRKNVSGLPLFWGRYLCCAGFGPREAWWSCKNGGVEGLCNAVCVCFPKNDVDAFFLPTVFPF